MRQALADMEWKLVAATERIGPTGHKLQISDKFCGFAEIASAIRRAVLVARAAQHHPREPPVQCLVEFSSVIIIMSFQGFDLSFNVIE